MFSEVVKTPKKKLFANGYELGEKVITTSISQKDLALFIKRAVDAAFDLKVQQLRIIMSPDENSLLSIKEVAELFGVSVVTIHSWKKEGKLTGFKRVGGRVYISENDCLDSMKEIKLKGKKD